MNTKDLLLIATIVFTMILGCTPKNNTQEAKVNGWYFVDFKAPDSIGEIIVSIKDFDSLKFESWKVTNIDGVDSVYVINGKVKPSKMKVYGDATRKSIGKFIVFLYNGQKICMPMLNDRIDKGNFAISSQALSSNKDKMLEMYESLKEEID
ncbi:hypothetical protein E2605_05280 [Dysgonomonas capnocytophagoides]|uniref:Uncharacterized protein n=1 Tax=Dysgonomonas capnocytophagoides TaxID=45254 RepID=A0A4Y8L976_9BACT|nr:hypothetical protein [Dysgonomonas capnocytophagoides]TFD98032.1 hypothetical protein E2605_05280 [Dysgonomonas capnocytophagoides]